LAELYTLAYFDKESGEFVEFIRKTRNYSIVGYDNLSSARRGLAHSKKSYRARVYDVKIVKATGIEIVREGE